MSEEQLELMITLDYPWYADDVDTFHDFQPEDAITFWLDQRFPIKWRLDDGHEIAIRNDPYEVTFGNGDWTCTLAKFSGTTNGPTTGTNEATNRSFEIEVCRVARCKEGKVVEEKMFYSLGGKRMQGAQLVYDSRRQI